MHQYITFYHTYWAWFTLNLICSCAHDQGQYDSCSLLAFKTEGFTILPSTPSLIHSFPLMYTEILPFIFPSSLLVCRIRAFQQLMLTHISYFYFLPSICHCMFNKSSLEYWLLKAKIAKSTNIGLHQFTMIDESMKCSINENMNQILTSVSMK